MKDGEAKEIAYLCGMAMTPAEKKKRLLEIAGDLPTSAIERHFLRLDNDYWNEFPAEEIRRHLTVLLSLNTSSPYSANVEALEDDLCGLTLIGGDFPGFLAAIAGFLACRAYDIRWVKAFTFAPEKELPMLPRGGIINFLLLRRSEGSCAETGEKLLLESEMEELFRRFGSGDADGVRVELYRRIGERLERRNGPASVVPLEIQFHSLNTGIQIEVRGRDREGMLFCIAAALSLQGLSVAKLLTRAHDDGSFEDRLTVTGPARQPLRGARELETIRTGIALMERLLETLPAATNLQAAAEGLQALVEDWLDESATLTDGGTLDVLPALSRVLTAGSQMWEMVNRLGPRAFRRLLQELVTETTPPDRENFLAVLRSLPSMKSDEEALFAEVRSFREREVIKAELDLLLTPSRDLDQFSERLGALAEALLIFTVETLRIDLTEMHGKSCPFSLFALGKFGGEELGAGSDLELLLIYRESGQTRGPESLSHAEFHEEICRRLLRVLKTRAGETLALDLRLRPHGESGPLAASLPAWKEYFASGGGFLDYEKQALIRMRFLLGDEELGRNILVLRDAIVYTDPPVPIMHTLELHAQQTALKIKPDTWNAKYSDGGMAELEYSIQFLQLARGASHKRVRQPNLARAMEALLETAALTLAEFEHLYAARAFLRRLINALRLVRGHAGDLHCPLPDSPDFTFLARRMGYMYQQGNSAESQLERELTQTRRSVNGFFRFRFLSGTKPEWLYDSLSEALMDPEAGLEEATPALLRLGMRDLPRARRLFLEFFDLIVEKRLAAACLLLFEGRLRRNPDPEGVMQKLNRYLESLQYPDVFLRQALHHPDLLETLLLVFANSDMLSNLAVREGENFKQLVQPETQERPRMPEDFDALAFKALRDPRLGEDHATRLCRLRNREYLRIALRDLRLDVPLREITHEISQLSDALLKAIWDRTLENSGPSIQKMCVLALGKLGGLELNYSSDIDLVFLAEDPLNGDGDREAFEKAGRELIGFLIRETPDGRLFRVDMNLRPWGSQGPLVGTVGQYFDYFNHAADGWELQAWIKARPVCGNVPLGERFARKVQRILCAPENLEKVENSMRKVRLMGLDKLFRGGTLSGEVKLGPGGIRTVEFYAQALQIRQGAEIPELITGNTLEALGRLNRYQLLASERFQMLSQAYVFLRRIEHRLQLQGLQQRHALPADSAELNRLARQMGFEDRIGQSAVRGFLEQYRKHMLGLQPISAELFSH